jgi:hypothetical protein
MKHLFSNYKTILLLLVFVIINCKPPKETPIVTSDNQVYAIKIETIKPIAMKDFASCESFDVQSSPTTTTEYDYFEGIPDTDGQVDVQVAVGGGYVVHATNSGVSIFDKDGKFLTATHQACFNEGIDPKLFFDIHNKVFAIDYWHYYDTPKKKPLNISVSGSADPTKSWSTYPISLTTAVDGGALGYSKKWLGYTYPKDADKGGTLLLSSEDARLGKETKVYHFDRAIGQPAFGQDATDDIFFLDVDDTNFTLHKITTDTQNVPYITKVWQKAHQLQYVDYPPASPQKGTKTLVSSGDRNPKNLVIQGGYLWFAHTINYNGQAAVQWHQLSLATGATAQTGILKKAGSNYIQSTIAVNKDLDVIVGFQESNANMYVSPCFAYRKASDAKGTLRSVTTIEKGTGNYGDGTDKTVAWGDYSGSIIDGDNLKDLWTVQSIMHSTKEVSNRVVKLKLQK